MVLRRIVYVAAVLALAAAVLTMTAACGDQFLPASTTPTTPTPPSPTVAAVTASVDRSTVQAVCPARFTFTGTISVSAAGTVTYRWERSDGSTTVTETVAFTTAGTQTVINTWDVGAPGSNVNGWERLHVLTPNDVTSSQASFTLNCGPVLSVSTGVDSSSYTGVCPHTFTFTGTIGVNSATSITFNWERSDGSVSPTKTLNFVASGSQTVTDAWALSPPSAPNAGWERLHVKTPNDLTSNQATFTLTCQ